ncbi:MAG: colicin E5-related ribonuclease [Pseudomonadota bacterium]
MKPERAEDPSDQKFYNMAADRQNNIIDLENRAASLQRDIDALGTSGGYATEAMQAELNDIEAELATLRPPATDSGGERPPETLSDRQRTIDMLATASPGAAQAMQVELDDDADALEERAHQLRQDIDALGTSGGYATEAMQAELNGIEADLAEFYDRPDNAGSRPRSSGGRSFDDPPPIPESQHSGAVVAALPLAGGAALADGPLPFGDALALGILGGAGIYAGYQWLTSSDSPNVHKAEAVDGADDDAKVSDDITIGDKIGRQSGQRGWNEESIKDVVDNPHTTRPATNKANGNDATAYYDEDGSHVVVDDVTGAVVQVSDRNNPTGWVPDSSIENPYRSGSD